MLFFLNNKKISMMIYLKQNSFIIKVNRNKSYIKRAVNYYYLFNIKNN